MPAKIKIEGLFEAIDAKDTDSFLTYLTDDAVFRYGSQDAVKGRAAIGDYVSGFFSTLKGLRHRITGTWERENSLVCQGEATYTKLDGKEVTLPFVNVFRLEKDRIRDYLVHIDPSPLMG
jgi:ketosteroid isomerase-like protein